MTLDGPRAMLAGEFDGGLQEGRPDAGSPVTTVDGEARNPPGSGIILSEHFRKSLVALDARERRTGPDPGPSGGMIIDVRNEPRRHLRASDLLMQRVAIIRCHFCNRRFRCSGAEEELAPAPRRVLAASAEHCAQVAPPIRTRGTDIDEHDLHHRAKPTVTNGTVAAAIPDDDFGDLARAALAGGQLGPGRTPRMNAKRST